MKAKEFIQYDGIGLQELIENKQVSPSDILDASFEQLEKVNPIVNGVSYIRKEAAYEEAGHAKTGSFAHVPIALKDLSQTIAGEPTTSGSVLFKDSIAKVTSNFTQSLLNTGATSIGNTTTPEFGLKNITEAKIHGPTRNPWNYSYSPGGSSGGAAAMVASGVVPIAGASDGGGSIRIPASFCSLVGLKPTRGRTAVGPNGWRNWQGAAIDFVLSKSVRDSARMLDQLQAFQEAAAFQTPLYEGSYENDLNQPFTRKMKIGFTTASPVGTAVSADAKEAVERVAKWLEAQGHHVEEVDNGVDGKLLMRNYFLMNSGEMASLVQELERLLDRKLKPSDMEVESWLLHLAGQSVSAAAYAQSLSAWDIAAGQMASFHEEYDFYLTPAAAFGAPKVGELTHTKEREEHFIEEMSRINNSLDQQALIWDMFLPSLAYTPFTQLANLTGQPAISLPTHLTEDGLPLGVQFMASKGSEHLLLKIASQLEKTDLWIGMEGNPYFTK